MPKNTARAFTLERPVRGIFEKPAKKSGPRVLLLRDKTGEKVAEIRIADRDLTFPVAGLAITMIEEIEYEKHGGAAPRYRTEL